MPEECTHDCSSCSLNCDSRKERPDTGIPESFLAPQNAYSTVRKVIAVVSGKGGVGKSLVTALAATEMKKRGYKTAILDADVTGPSIPKIFGLKEKADGTELGIIPVMTQNGIEVISINLLLENETDPVVWRGPIIAGTVKQFWTDVLWNDVDYMFVDMPPGTGDVPLTVFQSLPVDGILVVTSPQELVSMIVGKAVKMASMMQVPVLGIVENMAYFECPDCGSRHNIFGESHLAEAAEIYDVPLTAQIPIDPEIARKCDNGEVYNCKGDWLSNMTDGLIAMFDAADPHHRDPEKD